MLTRILHNSSQLCNFFDRLSWETTGTWYPPEGGIVSVSVAPRRYSRADDEPSLVGYDLRVEYINLARKRIEEKRRKLSFRQTRLIDEEVPEIS